MPDKKITDLVDGGALQPTDEFVVARAGDNFKIDGAEVVSAVTKHDVTLSGNTAGALALVSSGTLSLAGGNNITLSQAGNAVTISGAAQSVQPETQTFIAGVSASDTLYTSGNVRITGVGGGITVSSNTGQRIDLSVAAPVAQTVQTQNAVDLTLSGNTAGALALVSSGTATLAGGNNITLSQAGNAITISGANVGGAQTGISGLANSQTTYTSGTVSLSELGALTIRSSTGQIFQIQAPATSALSATGAVSISVNGSTISIGAPTQSVQPETQTFIAGISASNTLYTSGNVRITGVGGGVTVSSNTGQRVDISVAAPVAQTAQTGISGVANSQTTYTSGTVSLSELGAITIRSTTGNQYQLSVNAQSVQPETQTFIAGVSASDTLYTSGNVRITGVGGGVTVSSNTGQRVDISVAAPVAQTAQTGISGIANSQTTFTSGTVSLSELGAITIRSTTGNQYQLSVNSQTVQTQGGFASLGVSTGGNTAGNTTVNTGSRFVLVASGNLTASQATAAGASTVTLSVAAQSAQTGISGIANSQTTYTSGTVSLSELGAITIRSTTGNQYQLSVNAQSAQTGISGIANSQTTYTSGTVSLSELGAITIRSTTGNQYQLSVNSQSVQTQDVLSVGVSTGGNTAGNTTVNTGSRFVIVGSNGITASQGTAAGATTVTLSGVTQSVQTQGILNVALSNVGNTAGDTGINSGTRLVLSGGANITLSQVTAANATTVGIVGGAGGAGGSFSAGVSTGGNTAGATGITGTQLVFVGSNNISLSQTTGANGGTITINNTVSAFQAGVSTGGNTAGDTGVTGTRLVLVGDSPVSLSQATGANGATVTIDAPATSSLSATGAVEISTNGSTISIGAPNIKTLADWQNFPMGQATLITHAASISKTPFYFPAAIPAKITAKSFVIRLSAVTTATLQSFSVHAGIYTQPNSTSMALLGSWSESFIASTASSASWSGIRNYVMTGIGTHTALSVIQGGDYVVGLMFSAGAAGSMAQSILGAGTGGGPLGGMYPGVNQASTGTSQGIQALNGRGSTTVNALPANVVASELVNQGQGASMQLHPWIYIRS